MRSGYRLSLDYWADTGFSVKHGYVDEFIEGKSVNVTELTSNLVSIDNLPMYHVLYAFDRKDGTMLFLEHNKTIYMGKNMIVSLANPIK